MASRGTITTLLTTELNSLTNSSNSAAGTVFDNNETAFYTYADFELNVTYGTNPALNSLVELYLIPSLDDTNYADGGGSVLPPPSQFVNAFPVRAVTTAQRIVLMAVPIPPDQFKAVLRNGAGQTMAATGNTLKMVPYTP